MRIFTAVMIMIGLFICGALTFCAPSDTPTPAPTAQDTVRALPIVYWCGERGILPEPYLGVSPDSVVAFVSWGIDHQVTMELTEGDRVEWWRVEWKPVGDSCWTYLGGFPIPPGANKSRLPHIGVVDVRITGLLLGDSLMYWRSHPWPDSIPDGCFKHYRDASANTWR